MNKERTAAVVIMYHPEKHFLDNIATYIGQVARLYIVDNTENPVADFYTTIAANPKVTVIADHVNYGVAQALNIAGKKALNEGYSWLLTMDQDSYFNGTVITDYLAAAEAYPLSSEVAIFGLAYDKQFLSDKRSDEKYVEVNSLITSGSLLNLQKFHELQGFNEMLFIDEVDHDFCYRAVIAGAKIVCIRTGLLQHSLGTKINIEQEEENTHLTKTLHNPLRIYYIVRNGLYIASKFKKFFPREARRRKKVIYVTIKNNIIYGKQKSQVIKYAALGAWHYLTNRFYKL